ncbi:MAG TPA: acylphosphatase [Flavisolibacter sp.]|nr:acylphosphatase [Flavisolibacter sp.]
MPTVHLLIKGKVQGVFYRASAKEMAEALHLTGWVKNTSTGDVEAMATGPSDAVLKFIEWSKLGPPHAVVAHVEIIHYEEIEFTSFKIRKD